MANTRKTNNETGARKRGLGLYITLTFALTWGIAAMFVFAPDLVGPAGLGNPLYVVAVWAPAISGIVLAWNHLGLRGLRGFFSRLTMIRMPFANWLFLVVGVPVIVYAGAAISGTVDTTPVFSPWYTAIPALLAAMFLAGTVEEIGWRGVALPLLQRRFTPLTSGLLCGTCLPLPSPAPFRADGHSAPTSPGSWRCQSS